MLKKVLSIFTLTMFCGLYAVTVEFSESDSPWQTINSVSYNNNAGYNVYVRASMEKDLSTVNSTISGLDLNNDVIAGPLETTVLYDIESNKTYWTSKSTSNSILGASKIYVKFEGGDDAPANYTKTVFVKDATGPSFEYMLEGVKFSFAQPTNDNSGFSGVEGPHKAALEGVGEFIINTISQININKTE